MKKIKKSSRRMGKLFFLDCSLETIFERLKRDKKERPLLNNKPETTLSTLYNDRYSLYKTCSDYIINTDNITPNDIANKIEEYLNVWNRSFIKK